MGRSAVEDEDDDDVDAPATHLGDDEYDAFLAREFRADGTARGDPPVGAIIALIVLALLVLAVVLLT